MNGISFKSFFFNHLFMEFVKFLFQCIHGFFVASWQDCIIWRKKFALLIKAFYSFFIHCFLNRVDQLPHNLACHMWNVVIWVFVTIHCDYCLNKDELNYKFSNIVIIGRRYCSTLWLYKVTLIMSITSWLKWVWQSGIPESLCVEFRDIGYFFSWFVTID